MDRSGRQPWTTQERRHCHVRLWRRSALYHPPQSSRIHFPRIRWRSAYHRRVRFDRLAAPHDDTEQLQELVFLSRKASSAVLSGHGVVQWTHLRCKPWLHLSVNLELTAMRMYRS